MPGREPPKLMMRAGLIKRLGAGIYNYMPMGLRVIRKGRADHPREMTAPAPSSC